MIVIIFAHFIELSMICSEKNWILQSILVSLIQRNQVILWFYFVVFLYKSILKKIIWQTVYILSRWYWWRRKKKKDFKVPNYCQWSIVLSWRKTRRRMSKEKNCNKMSDKRNTFLFPLIFYVYFIFLDFYYIFIAI